MQEAAHGQVAAILRAAIHISAAIVIVWYIYRVANGHTTLL
jgi:hypothetical protein